MVHGVKYLYYGLTFLPVPCTGIISHFFSFLFFLLSHAIAAKQGSGFGIVAVVVKHIPVGMEIVVQSKNVKK